MSASESDANMTTQDSPQKAFAEERQMKERNARFEKGCQLKEDAEDESCALKKKMLSSSSNMHDDNMTLPKEASAKDNDSVLKVMRETL